MIFLIHFLPKKVLFLSDMKPDPSGMKYKKKCTTSIISPSMSLKVIEKTWYMNDMHKGWSLYKIKQINIEVYNYINVIFGIHRSSPWRCSVKIGILKNFAKFTGKHLFQSLFFNKETLEQVFSCEFCEILKTTFF